MTLEEQLARLLACALYQLGGSLDISKKLLDEMKPTRLVWDTESVPDILKLSVLSQEILIGSVEKEDDGNTEPLLDVSVQ